MKKETVSQWITIAVLASFTVLLSTSNAFSAIILKDDFSATYIDGNKWSYREIVRETDPIAGKLVSKIGSDSGTGQFRNRTSFLNPESITTIQCEVTLVDTILDTGNEPSAFMRIDGRFYKTGAGTGQTGDIWAGVYIGDRGSGLEGFWQVVEVLNDDGTEFELRGSGTLIPPGTLTHGTAYIVKIAYDGNNGFQFTVNGVNEAFAGPERTGDEALVYKGLVTGVDSDGGSGNGYVHVLFENVYINDELMPYDTFDSAPLDSTLWQSVETAREISGGKLRMNRQSHGDSRETITMPLDAGRSYLESKITVKSDSWVDPGGPGIARIGGYYYNDTYGPGSGGDYNGEEGEVWVQNTIELDDDDNLVAFASAARGDDASGSSWTEFFNFEFSTSISFDTEYTLSIEFTGSALILKCNGETVTHDITTPVYDSRTDRRYLQSRVYDPGAGYMKADFDDVYVSVNTIRVPLDLATIQAAIDNAEDEDTILVAPGTYVEDIDFLGKPVTVRSEAGPDSTTISSSGGDVVTFTSGETQTTSLEGFRLEGMIHILGSSPNIENCKLLGAGVAQGGGVGTIWEDASPTMTKCVISEGNAEVGGAFDIISSSASFINCTFFANNASTSGGGLYLDNSSVTLTNCSFWGNTATESGGAIYCGNSSSLNVVNTILWNDSAPTDAEIHNSSSSINATYCDIEGGYGGEGNIDADPAFVDPGNGDFHLSSGSPCIDAGTSEGAPGSDIDGELRPQGATYDMGADEVVFSGNELAVDFRTTGIYVYDDSTTNWNRIYKGVDPDALCPFGSYLSVDFGVTYGLYVYDSGDWTRVYKGVEIEQMAQFGGKLAVDFGMTYGIYEYDYATDQWNRIYRYSELRDSIVGWGDKLVVDFKDLGIYLYDAGVWTRIYNGGVDPIRIVSFGDKLAVDFGVDYGLYVYESTTEDWSRIYKGVTIENITSFGGKLAVDFGTAYGLYLYEYDTDTWERVYKGVDIDRMSQFGGKLAVDFGTSYGIYEYDHSLDEWTRIYRYDVERDEICACDILD